jgi:hypothetical protein
MKHFNFYYDETEHSRKINHRTVSASNYHDDFIAAAVGWDKLDESDIEEKFHTFEEKYSRRMVGNELKSTTIKQSQLTYGFASLSKSTAALMNDFFDLFDESVFVYLSAFSKTEYIVRQVFSGYENSPFIDMDLLKYSVTKAIVTYRPEEVIQSLYAGPEKFLESLRDFLRQKIEEDSVNIDLKHREIEQFVCILLLLENAEPIKTFDWDYGPTLATLKAFIQEKSICEYSLIIDREARTAESARNLGFEHVSEGNSKELFALRMADLLAGIAAKLMKALAKALKYRNPADEVRKKLLDVGWFKLTEERLAIYKKLHRIVMQSNNAWHKVSSGVYSDNLICFTTFLSFVDNFSSPKDIQDDLPMMPEYFNAAACAALESHYAIVRDTLPAIPTNSDNSEYFFNQRGGKEYFDVNRQPYLEVGSRAHTYNVLAVDVRNGKALVTLEEDDKVACYALPDKLYSWAETLVDFASSGVGLFPEKVTFTPINGELSAHIH